MDLLGPDVLEDERSLVPAAPPGTRGLAWLRASVPRFCDGEAHTRRRALVDALLRDLVLTPAPGVDPTVVLLRALGLPEDCLADVATVAAAYQPHARQSPDADAALERLVQRCGRRDEESAARICVLVQAHGALHALLADRRAGVDRPPVATTRRVTPDGRTVEVDLTGAPFGRGRHACPGRSLVEVLAP